MTPRHHVLGIFVGAGGFGGGIAVRETAHKACNAFMGADPGHSVTGLLP